MSYDFVSRPDFDEYSRKYARYFAMRRQAGIVELRMHTDEGPAVFSLGMKNAWGQVWQDVGNDPHNEVLILTGTGDAWIGGVDHASFSRPPHEWPADAAYDHLYYDAMKLLENLVFSVDIPTVGVLNGPGIRKEMALLCDLTLCADDTTIADGNFAAGQAPGDGMHLVLQELIGAKRAAQYLYSGEPITSAKALELGLVNEVLPRGQLLPRAWELAEMIMSRPRIARRMTHAIVQRPWKRRLGQDQGFGLAHEQFGAQLG